jgi:plastocyanin
MRLPSRSTAPRGAAATVALLILLSVATGARSETAKDGTAVVSLTDNFQFEPREVTLHVGDALEWRNESHFNHTVTADPRQGSAALPAGVDAFSSEELRPGASFRHVFSVPGKYTYFCMPHEGIGMVGQVTVLPK